ncbi:MAG: HAD family phosphatase [Fusobacteria bacterium]|nr:MAG: HAD family phosphatase [Fusobacteriota bacterium]
MIKAVMLDLDGTLLTDDHIISDTNKEVLKKLIEKGVKVYLVTGRSFDAMKQYHQELGLDTPAICYNGAKIVYPNGEFNEYPIRDNELKTLIDIAHETETHLNIYQHEVWYCENTENEETKTYIHISGLTPTQINFNDLKELFSTKILYIADHEKLLEVEREIKSRLGNKVFTTFSKPFFLEVLYGDVNKGSTMEKIMKKEGIDLADVIAFGDGLNDLEMLQMAGIGVAMEKSFPELLKVADEVTGSNNESGVGEFLKRYL